jgi:hypothetical protein
VLRLGIALIVALVSVAPAAAAPVTPEDGGIYAVGTEFEAPCVSSQFPWNNPATAGYPELTLWEERDEYTLLAYDVDGDGFDYELTGSSDDRLLYVRGPQVDFPYAAWTDAFDTAGCYSHAMRYVAPMTSPPPWPRAGSNDDGDGPHGQDWTTFPNPRPSDPIVASREGVSVHVGVLNGLDSVVGAWRWERWREISPWYWEDNGNCPTGTPEANDRNPDCWGNQDPDDPEVPIDRYELIERRDFFVEDAVVVITLGPSGETGAPAAQFEFTYLGEDTTGTYQCSLDGGEFQACASPASYSGLADGTHTFEVRYVLPDGDPDAARITKRQWAVDTTPPSTIIQEAPSGEISSTSATIRFISTEPDSATYRCRLDGGAERDCSNPERLSGLADGPHLFEVRSRDRAGNQQPDWTPVAFSVRAAAGGGGSPGGGGGGVGVRPPLPESTNCEDGRVEAGPLVAVGRAGTCFTERVLSATRKAFSAAGPTTVNGVQMNPPSGKPLQIEAGPEEVELTVPDGTTFALGDVAWRMPAFSKSFAAGAKSATYTIPFRESLELKIAGLELAATPKFSLTSEGGGSTRIEVALELPELFSGAAGAEGGASFEYAFTASNAEGVKHSAKAKIDRAWLFGKVKVSGIELALAGPPLAFEGSASMEFTSGVAGDTKFTITVGLSEEVKGSFPLVSRLGLQASGIDKPLGYGIFLQRLGGEFTRCTSGDGGQVAANGGLSLGPEIDLGDLFEGEMVSLDGKVTLALCDPRTIEVSGESKIVDIPVGQAALKYTWGGIAELSGKVDWSVGLYGVDAEITEGRISAKAVNVEARGTMFLFGQPLNQAETLVSSKGIAACFDKAGKRVGLSRAWGGSVNFISSACDVGPMRAATAQSGDTRSFTVPPGAGVHVLELAGTSAFTLRDPAGQVVPVDVLQTERLLVVRDPGRNVVTVVLYDPAPGTWTVEGGGALSTAAALPAPTVKARVSGRGGKRTLTWKVGRVPGQSVSFVERGARTLRTLGTSSKASGRLRFTPDPAAGTRRTIEAVFSQGGAPRNTLVAARYTAPPPPRLGRVRGLKLRRGVLTWRWERAAASYSVAVRLRDGRTIGAEPRKPRLKTGVRRGRVRVTVTPIGRDGSLGPVATARLKAR